MTWLGKKAAWFTLHKSENEDIDIGDALVREKGIGRRGRKGAQRPRRQEAIESNESRFSDPRSSDKVSRDRAADARLINIPASHH